MLNLAATRCTVSTARHLFLALALLGLMARSAAGQLPHPPRISGGGLFSAALLTNDTLQTWGSNSSGQLGRGWSALLSPSQVNELNNIVDIDCGGSHMLAITTSGTVMSWGGNSVGQLGLGHTSMMPFPQAIPGVANAARVSAGEVHSLVLLASGTVLAFGSGTNGRLGLGNTNNALVPTPIPGLTNAIAISAGASHSAAVLSTGAVAVWGNNAQGQLGIPWMPASNTPILVAGLSAVTNVTCGLHGTVCLDAAGAVHHWGLIASVISLPQIAPMPPASKIDSALNFRCHMALTSTGLVHAWGEDCYGILGTSACASVLVPSQITALGSGNLSVALGGMHAMVMTQTGAVQTWGSNGSWQLGYSTPVLISTMPAPVPGLDLTLFKLHLVPAGAYTQLLLLDGSPLSIYANLCTAIPQTTPATGLINLGGLLLSFADVIAWSTLIHAGNPMATGSLNALGSGVATLPIPNSTLTGLTINAVSLNVLAGNITYTSPVVTHMF